MIERILFTMRYVTRQCLWKWSSYIFPPLPVCLSRQVSFRAFPRNLINRDVVSHVDFARSSDQKKPLALLYKASRLYKMYYGYSMHCKINGRTVPELSDVNWWLNWKSRVIRRGLKLRHSIRGTLFVFRGEMKGRRKGNDQPSVSIYSRSPRYTITMRCNGDTVASAPRATMQSVRTTGNNWTIYEPRGLALRMYDYRGKRCVAHTLWTSLWRTSWPHHHHPFPPSLPSTACNYSRGHCISIPRLIVKIRAGNSAEGQYRRGQRSFCALSTRSREPVVLQGYLYKISRNRRFMLSYSLKSAYLRAIARI